MIEYGILYVCGIHGKDLGLIKDDDCMNNDFQWVLEIGIRNFLRSVPAKIYKYHSYYYYHNFDSLPRAT